MSRERKIRGICATSRGYTLLQEAKAKKRFTYKRIALEAEVNERTVCRFFTKQRVDESSARAIIGVFGLEISEVIAPHEVILEKSIEDAEYSKQNFLYEIKIKEEVIERFHQQGSLYESDLKRLEAEKAELEIYVQHLDELLSSLKTIGASFGQRMEISREGANWLNERRQKDLAREAAEYVLLNHASSKNLGEVSDFAQVKQFAKDIRKYLYLIHHCLQKGSYNLLHKARMESKIAFTLEPVSYVAAFIFIKDYKIPKDMPSIVADEIKFYLDYFIKFIEP